MSMDRLLDKIIQMKNPTVAGLDPKLDFIPTYIKDKAFEKHGVTLKGAAKAILEYNKGLIDALCEVVPAVKPQCAYYEMYGSYGVKTLHKTIEYAKSKGLYVITDGKRNDIGATMEAYAIAHLGVTDVEEEKISAFDGDALTVNGYLGSDGILPLLDVCDKRDKGIFVLVKTSNKSSGELQDQMIGDKTVYQVMGQMCEQWGSTSITDKGYSSVGAVVGATYPEQLEMLRKEMPHTMFLVPGYGAQGGDASDVKFAFDKDGLGAIVNSSRAIMCAYKTGSFDEKDYTTAAYLEAVRMKKEITSHIAL